VVCHTRADFESERYEPVFSPRAYPGQTVTIVLRSVQTAPAAVRVTPFLTRAMTGDRVDLPADILPEGAWTELTFVIPELEGDAVHELGWRFDLELREPPWAWGKVFIDRITVSGPADYTVDTGKQRMEFAEPFPFSSNGGEAAYEDGALALSSQGPAQAFTGNYYARKTVLEATLLAGDGCLLLRGQGTRRYYALGFGGPDKAVIARWDGGTRTELAAAPFTRTPGKAVRLRGEADGDRLSLSVDGVPVLTASDSRFACGMAGVCHEAAGDSRWTDFHIAADTE
jgi:hypothetical protein